MDSNKLANWLQVGANIGLLGGLVLVAIQINQNSDQLGQSHQLVRAQLLSNFYDAWITIDSSKQSENFAEVLSKSIAKPKDLSLKEMVELNGYLFSLFDNIDRINWLNENGVFSEGIERTVSGIAREHLGNSFARAWWEENRNLYDPKIATLVDRELQSVSENERLEYFRRIQARLK